MKLNNKYYILRHGEALSNVKNVISSWPEKFKNPLTEQGKRQAKEAGELLKGKKIDLIFSSDILRAKQTAQIVGKMLEVKVRYDKRLREYNVGVFNGMPVSDFSKEHPDVEVRFRDTPKAGENYNEITNRVYDFLEAVDKKYKGKNIVIVSHQVPLALLAFKVENLTQEEVFREYFNRGRLKNAEVKELN